MANGMVLEAAYEMSDVQEQLRIYETHDLTIFKRRINRPINPKKVDRLVQLIRRKNLLMDYPILVDKEMRIIDGQHRVEAARKLGLPIYYRFAQEGVEISDIALASQGTTHWSWQDYLEFYVGQGNEDYKELAELKRMTSARLTLSNLAELACNLSERTAISDLFKSGHYVPNRMDYAVEVLLEVEKIIETIGADARQRPFVTAYAACRRYVTDFDPNRFLTKITQASSPLSITGQTIQSIKDIERIYNYRVPLENRMDLRKEMSGYIRNRGWTW